MGELAEEDMEGGVGGVEGAQAGLGGLKVTLITMMLFWYVSGNPERYHQNHV